MTSQFQILNKILQHKDFSLVVLNNLTDDHFFNYRSEFKYIRDHYEHYGVVPDRLTFVNTFGDFDIVDINEPDSYLIEQLFKDYNSAFLASKFNEIKQRLERDDVAGAMSCLTKAAEDMHSGTAMTSTDLFKDISRFDRYVERINDREKHFLSTGFKELDDITGGIDRKEENMVISARSGIGKSWVLMRMAAAAANQGLTVGIYSGEMSADKVGYRIDTLLGHIDNRAITRGQSATGSVTARYKNFLEELQTRCPGSIKVVTPLDIAGPATVSALRAFVEKDELDILFIDQYSLLEDQHHAKTTHEKVANISKDIKNLQVMSQIPIISVSQMNRTKNEDGQQDTSQIALSDRIGQDATSIIMLDREATYADADKCKIIDDKLILNIVKSRDGGSGKLMYKADFNFGNFTYLDPKLTDSESEELRDYYDSPYDDDEVPF